MSIYERAIKCFGEQIQFVVAMEECSELIRALSKVIREGRAGQVSCFQRLAEEVADVQIMLDQMKVILDGEGSSDWELVREAKLDRLDRLIEDTMAMRDF